MVRFDPGSQKPSARPNARSGSRNVYGKRKTAAANAVLDRGLPVSEHAGAGHRDSDERAIDGLVEFVQEKFSAVTIGNKEYDTPEPAELNRDAEPPEEQPQAKNETIPTVKSNPKPKKGVSVAVAVVMPTWKGIQKSGQNNQKEEGMQMEDVKQKQDLMQKKDRKQKEIQKKEHRKRDEDQKQKEVQKQEGRKQNEEKEKDPSKPHPGYVDDPVVHSYVKPILEEAISSLASKGVQQFQHWARGAGDHFTVQKIAEGSYGEVYQLHLSEDLSKRDISRSKLIKLKAYDDGVFKIVPLRAQKGPGSKKFTSVKEIVSEVQLLKLLDPVPGFARFREVHIVQGRFPDAYQKAWDIYRDTSDDCFNPDPRLKKSYPDTQLWAILEMDNAGHELEKFTCSSVSQIYDIFWGVALGLARAEQLSEFEHRDLHLGNICIKRNSTEGLTDDQNIDHSPTGFGFSGLETTIIDYSLSRAEFQSEDGNEFNIAWSDLDKKQIFDAIGRHEEEKLLRDTYRRMRSHIYQNNFLDEARPPKIPGQWQSYNPGTNLIWLSFMLEMLLRRYKLRETSRPPLGERDANSQIVPKESKTPHDLKGKSSSTPLPSGVLHEELEHELIERLETVLGFLDVEDEENELGCAGDLVATAIGLQWLSETDFLC